MKILMVCLGNICRSPMAQGLMEHKIKFYGLPWQVDSAGTSSFHAGERPDERAIACMKKYGIDISNQSARPFQIKDFDSFNLIYCMDKSNYRHVLNLGKNNNHKEKIKLILHECDECLEEEVPDPYYGGMNGFDNVYFLLDKATDGIIRKYMKTNGNV